jgi:hypothetical protein
MISTSVTGIEHANNLAFLLYLLGVYRLEPTRSKRQLGYMKIMAHEWTEFKIEQGDIITKALYGHK